MNAHVIQSLENYKRMLLRQYSHKEIPTTVYRIIIDQVDRQLKRELIYEY